MTTKKKQLPFISVCTPTFNRRPFIETMFNCFRNQTYPKNRIEWIIVDDGTDKIRDLVEKSDIPQIRYFEVGEKMSLGAKRNYMHRFVRGTIIVYMDDDDYYPPERIEDAVEKLEANPNALAAGSSEIYIYFKHIQKMYKCGPYNPNHATAGTFAFRTDLLKQTKYEEGAAVAEERAFLKDYTIPFVQLDPMKAILVFSHNHNTFDKRKMLDNPHPDFFRECDKTVDMFIRNPSEKNIYDFFMTHIDPLLENYEPGEPKMKPDVLKQIKEIEEKRDQMIKEELSKQQAGSQIMLQQPGKPPLALNNQQIVEMIQQQQQQLQQLVQKCEESDKVVSMLQKQLVEKTKAIRELSLGIIPEHKDVASDELKDINDKLEGMIVLLQKQLIEKTKSIRELSKTTSNNDNDNNDKRDEMQNVITALQKQLIEKTKAIRELTASNNTDELKNMIHMLQEQSLEKTKSIKELNSQLPELKATIISLEEQLSNKSKTIIDLNSSVDSLKFENLQYYSKNNEIEVRLENKVRQLEGIVTMLQSQLTDKNMEVIEASQKQTDFSKKYSDVSQKYTELTQKYLDISHKYSEANMRIADLSQELAINAQSEISEPIQEEEFTRIPIQLEDSSKTEKGKSDPEFCVDAED